MLLQANRLRLGSHPGRRAAAWSPAVLPLLGWWSIDGPGTLYGDPSGTTQADASNLQTAHATLSAAEPEDTIRAHILTDRSGNGHHLQQLGLASNKPLFGEGKSIAGLHAVNHIDNGGYLLATWTEVAQPYTVALVAAPELMGAGVFLFDGVDDTRRQAMQPDSNTWTLFAGSTWDTLVARDTDEAPRVYVCQYNGASSEFWREGAAAGGGNTGTLASAGITMGARFNGASVGEYAWSEALVIEGTLSDGDREALEAYLAAKWQ